MPLVLEYRAETTVPVEVPEILPEAICNRSLTEIEKLPIQHGNRQLPLAEFFRISGTTFDARLEFRGDLAGVHSIGARMREGSIQIAGSAGRHLGAQMHGGTIDVEGDAGDWLGAEMHGGSIRVRGKAGGRVGAAYLGSPRGMSGGTILVDGSAGDEIGHTMRRGLIAIGGSIGDFAAINMIAGTLLVFGDCGVRPGAGMRRGSLVLFGNRPPELLPTFRPAGVCRPAFPPLYFRALERRGMAIAPQLWDSDYALYHGDLLAGGRGEIVFRAKG